MRDRVLKKKRPEPERPLVLEFEDAEAGERFRVVYLGGDDLEVWVEHLEGEDALGVERWRDVDQLEEDEADTIKPLALAALAKAVKSLAKPHPG